MKRYEEVPHEPDFDFLPSADPFGPPALLFSVATSTGEHLLVPRWWLQPPPHLPNLRPGNLEPFDPFSSSSQLWAQLEPPSPLSPKSPWSRFSSEREPNSPGSGWDRKKGLPKSPLSPGSPSRQASGGGGASGPGGGISRRYSFAGFGSSSGGGPSGNSANNSVNGGGGAGSVRSSRDSVDGSRDSFMSRDFNDFIAGDRVLMQRPHLIKKTAEVTAEANKDNLTSEAGKTSKNGGAIGCSIAESEAGGDASDAANGDNAGSNDGSEGSDIGAFALALPSDIVRDESAAAAELNTSWNKAAVHAVASDGTLLLRHAPSGALQRGVFPELCAPDAGDARKLPKPLLWKHPCGGCGRRRNLKEDAVCVACGKSKNFAFSDVAHRHLKRVHKLERLVVKPKAPARSARDEASAVSMASASSSRRPSLAPVERRPSLVYGNNGSTSSSVLGNVSSSSSSNGSTSSTSRHLSPATLLSPRQKEPSSPLLGADGSPTERLQPTVPRRLSMRRGLMRRNSKSRQSSSGLDTLGEVAVEER